MITAAHAHADYSLPLLPLIANHHHREDSCRSRAKARMLALGIPSDMVEKAARSNAVFDHMAATFSVLLTEECRIAHSHLPIIMGDNCTQVAQ